MLFSFVCCQAQVRNYVLVTDEKGNAVGGANVHLLNTDFFSQSDDSGHFSFPALPKGLYNLEILAIGFARIERPVELPISGALKIPLVSSTKQLDAVEIGRAHV